MLEATMGIAEALMKSRRFSWLIIEPNLLSDGKEARTEGVLNYKFVFRIGGVFFQPRGICFEPDGACFRIDSYNAKPPFPALRPHLIVGQHLVYGTAVIIKRREATGAVIKNMSA